MSITNADIKIEIEQYFKDNWSTPIQYQYDDFDMPSDNKWISLEYIGIERTSNSCSRTFVNSQLRIRCYDNTGTLSIKLTDQINAFFDCYQGTLFYSGNGNPDGLGVQSLSNNVFESATIFEINSLI